MITDDRKFSVYKGLQRPIMFKGLKGSYIYYAFALALSSMVIAFLVTVISSILTGTFVMAVVVFGGIIGMALYQRKFGLYRKRVSRGVFVIHSIFNTN